MTQYRGYYIDHVFFNSKKEIDEKIKSDNISKMQKLIRMGFNYSDAGMMMTAFAEADRVARFLVSECGMTYGEVEALQNV